MQHLTRSQRDQLQALVRAKQTQTTIAQIIGCSQPTVSRELKRYQTKKRGRYTASIAQKRAELNRIKSYEERLHWYDDEMLLLRVEEELRDGKSPDQIAGRIKYEGWGHAISHQTIYTYIEKDKKNGGDLYKSLRYQGKKYKWRGVAKDSRIPNRKGIEERPEIVDKKGRSGDWESDLVVSNKESKGAVATFAERTSMYYLANLVVDRSADEMVRASCEVFGDIPEIMRQTMTHDNGKEISKHEEITKKLNIDVYCARPYRSSDRGLNEFMNRELRRFFPKGTNFSNVTQKEIDYAIQWLNNCPRRSLNYRTPKEVFKEKLGIMHFTL